MSESLLNALKWVAVFLIITTILGSVFFTNLLTKITETIAVMNQDFLSFVPGEILTILLIVVFALIISVGFVIFQ